jgi:DNA-binding NarL/FixJ family response regulator
VPKSSISVFVVDDYEPFRRFICTELQNRPPLRIVAEAADGGEAVQKAGALQPELILLDVGLPTLNGIEAAKQIRTCAPESKILFVSENRSPAMVDEALRTGARGYLVKSDAARELLPAVEAVLQGKQFVSASLAASFLVTSGEGASEKRQRIEFNPYLRFGHSGHISEFLASIINATAADFGTVQLFDSANGVLRIVAQHGFESEFLRYFDTVSCKDKCVCGTAMNEGLRTVVTNVATDPLFSSDARGVLLSGNVHSVQSTPLIDPSGRFVGMVSTHYIRSGGPMSHMWKHLDDLAASFLAKIKAEVSPREE